MTPVATLLVLQVYNYRSFFGIYYDHRCVFQENQRTRRKARVEALEGDPFSLGAVGVDSVEFDENILSDGSPLTGIWGTNL